MIIRSNYYVKKEWGFKGIEVSVNFMYFVYINFYMGIIIFNLELFRY